MTDNAGVTEEELREALHGLFADDMGAPRPGAGMRGRALRDQVKGELHARRGSAGWAAWLARTVRDMWLSDEALAGGYDAEEAFLFLDWLPKRMACPLEAAVVPA